MRCDFAVLVAAVDKHIFAVGQLQKNTVPLMNVYHVHDKLAVNG